MESHIDEIVEAIKASGANVYAVSEIADGVQRTVHLISDSVCRSVYSVSKTYVMVAIGLLYDEGKVKPENTMSDIFPNMEELKDSAWADITVHDLLRHRTGSSLNDLDIDGINSPYNCIEGDWLAHQFKSEIPEPRGEVSHYTDNGFYVLARVAEKLSGENLLVYLRRKLFEPLGYGEVGWSVCNNGHCAGGSGMFISCEDMTKLGFVWTNGGVYNGQRLLSKEWIDLANKNSYGFSETSPDFKGVTKGGLFEQRLFMSEELNYTLGFQSYEREISVNDVINRMFAEKYPEKCNQLYL